MLGETLFFQGRLLIHDHLHLHRGSSVHPERKCTLLHPVVHLAENNLPVSFRRLVLPIELEHRVEALPHQLNIKGLLHRGGTILISSLDLYLGAVGLVLVKGLSEEPLSHLVQNNSRTILLLDVMAIDLFPLVQVLLQVALVHDADASVQCFPGRAIHLALLHLNLFSKGLNSSLKTSILCLHLH